jgi:hypothetical protein
MGANYSEIICTAIDEIVNKRISDLSYDITRICTIVDDSLRKNGKYIVSDGSINFDAYCVSGEYLNGESVLVTIPNGDYTY